MKLRVVAAMALPALALGFVNPAGVGPGGPSSAPAMTVEAPYTAPAVGLATTIGNSGVWWYDCDQGLGCVVITVPKGAGLMTLEVIDDHSDATMGMLGSTHERFCNALAAPERVTPGEEVFVHLPSGECRGAPAVNTQGIVRATFQPRPPRGG